MGDYNGVDRISILPSDIIDNILKRLSVRDAVRTSILSRPWRYKWVTIPHLVFEFSFPAKKPYSPKYNIESIIQKILGLHQGPIVKFSVETYDFRVSYKAVDHWLYCLSSHPIEELIINCLDPPCHPISHYLFVFDRLRHLHLENFDVRLPSTFNGFGRLVILHLYDVCFAPGDFKIFLSKCTMLESLIVMDTAYEITSGDLGDIDLPNLKSFGFSSCFLIPIICFKNAPLLAEITVSFSSYDFMSDDSDPALSVISGLDEYKNYLIKFIDGLSSLTTLVLGGCFLQFSASDDLSGMETSSEFLVKMRTEHEFTLSRLEYVKIDSLMGWEHEMEFVKLLLSAATALGKLEIRFNDPWRAEGNDVFMNELSSFDRASPGAQLIFQIRMEIPLGWGVMNFPDSGSSGSSVPDEEYEDKTWSGSSVPVEEVEEKTLSESFVPVEEVEEKTLSESSVPVEEVETKTKERVITLNKNIPAEQCLDLVPFSMQVDLLPFTAAFLSPPASSDSVHFHLSSAAVSVSRSARTLCLRGLIHEHSVTVLIDSSSSHNIIQSRVAAFLGLYISPVSSFSVVVGNGDTLHCSGVCHDVPISMQSHHFTVSLYVIPIYGADIVLGVQWLGSLGPFLSNFSVPSMQFYHNNALVTLSGSLSSTPHIASFSQLRCLFTTDDMLRDGIIRPNTSPFSSLVLLIKKRDGSWRFCVDYRGLNAITDHSVFAKLSKCSFGVTSTDYLGHIISSAGVAADPSKLQAIVDWPAPYSLTALRAFLGLIGYYRCFVRGYAFIAGPLTDLVRRSGFSWTPTAATAFDALKSAMLTLSMLSLTYFSQPFDVTIDASQVAVGAVLSQRRHPIAFFSKKLSPCLQVASAYEREMYAISEAVGKWRQYMIGWKFRIYTDQQSLKRLLSQTIQIPAQQKLLTELLGYDFDIFYIPRRENPVADALSRIPLASSPAF
ncbi:UNVERIFIED_CONTAM: Retrovirus-related Pol polyprotein from transposon [Sesamum radiatum]|uniref:RNA-directed DNA polymerase n=1 Tax=Sesamum radiatum TaxID=300843 RepID=A0AAW2QFD0_SESRA